LLAVYHLSAYDCEHLTKKVQAFIEDIMAKILVVDDDKGATDLLEAILLATGHQAVVINDSSKAMETATQEKPNLILLDLMMPEPTGFQLCRMLRQNPDFRTVPIVIITALDNTDSRVVAIGAGANGFLRKPFHVSDLTDKIKDLLPEK
jgi:DNA-binding response OmpR family regulator